MQCVPMSRENIKIPWPSTWWVQGNSSRGSLYDVVRKRSGVPLDRVLGRGARPVSKSLLRRVFRAHPKGFALTVFDIDKTDEAFDFDKIDVPKYDMGRYILRRRLRTYRFVPVDGDVFEFCRQHESLAEGIDVGPVYYDLNSPADVAKIRRGQWVHCVNRNLVINLTRSDATVLGFLSYSDALFTWVECDKNIFCGPCMVLKPCPPGSKRNPSTKRCRKSKTAEKKAVKKIQKFVDLLPADQDRVVNASDRGAHKVATSRTGPKGHAKDYAGKIAKGINGKWWESRQVAYTTKTGQRKLTWRWKPYVRRA